MQYKDIKALRGLQSKLPSLFFFLQIAFCEVSDCVVSIFREGGRAH